MTAREVASWARKAREATLRRDEAIRAMRGEGATLRAIADAAGLTHTAVAKILSREADVSGRPVAGAVLAVALSRLAVATRPGPIIVGDPVGAHTSFVRQYR